jgi:hypothetical protein
MAGSYKHIVDDKGRYHGPVLLDHMGDAYEALEECYGMIWFLADGDPIKVERARTRYQEGLEMSPGVKPIE